MVVSVVKQCLKRYPVYIVFSGYDIFNIINKIVFYITNPVR